VVYLATTSGSIPWSRTSGSPTNFYGLLTVLVLVTECGTRQELRVFTFSDVGRDFGYPEKFWG